MSFRRRVLLAFSIVVLVPVAVMGLGVRAEIEERLEAQYRERVEALASVIEEDLARESRQIEARLTALGSTLGTDNRLRAALQESGDPGYLIDWAGDAMGMTGLAMLQLQEPGGRILSSGHFRNAFDLVDADLPESLAGLSGGAALTPVRTPTGSFLALVRRHPVTVASTTYHLVGGRRVGPELLTDLDRDPELSVRLVHPGGNLAANGTSDGSDREVVREIPLPWIPAAMGGPASAGSGSPDSPNESLARFEISYDGSTIQEIHRSTARWLALVLSGSVVLSLLLAGWLSGRVTRPLEELASRTREVDLDRLDIAFPVDRNDEVGQLAGVLGEMTARLRASARDLRDAERRATRGEMARQVNHDVKNGLVPIRNVLRHLDSVAESDPGSLPRVFEERRRSLGASVAYLETLAGNYARLSSRAGTDASDPVVVAAQVVDGAAAGTVGGIRLQAAGDVPWVGIDPVSLRRILENLVANAQKAVVADPDAHADARGGEPEPTCPPIAVTVEAIPGSGQDLDRVRIVVEDEGPGMSPSELERVFEDFYTTRDDGTGLGLPLVRRLVRDVGGSVVLESEPGGGTRAVVELPATTTGSAGPADTGNEGDA